MYPELLGKPVIVRFKKHKLEGNLIYFDKNKLILILFDKETIEIVLKYDALEPNLYCGESDVDYKVAFEQLCASNYGKDINENTKDIGGSNVQKKIKIEKENDQ